MLKRACICTAILTSLIVLGLPIALARSNDTMLVHVAFDFYVRDRVLPAGDYSVSELTNDGMALQLRSADNHKALAVLTQSAEVAGRQTRAPHLIFHRYGEQYFLAAVWLRADAGRTVVASRRERSLRRELARAGQQAQPEVVTLAADAAGN